MNIVILEPIGLTDKETDQSKAKFESLGHTLTAYNNRPNDDSEIIDRIKNAKAIILSNLPLSEEVILECPNLKMISVAFAGVDHIPLKLCVNRNILVSNAAGYSNHAVAELTVGSAISLFRKIIWHDSQTRQSLTREGFLGSELHNKTFGIIGLGQIGLQVAKLALAFGCRVIAFSRTVKDIKGVQFCELECLLKESDIVSFHLPLTEDTRYLIGENEINLMKSTSIVINTARGPIIEYKALSNALIHKKIGGAAVDVYEEEPPLDKNHPLFDAPNTILLPHIGYATKEAIQLRGEIVIENILKWIEGKPQNVMN